MYGTFVYFKSNRVVVASCYTDIVSFLSTSEFFYFCYFGMSIGVGSFSAKNDGKGCRDVFATMFLRYKCTSRVRGSEYGASTIACISYSTSNVRIEESVVPSDFMEKKWLPGSKGGCMAVFHCTLPCEL